MSQVCASCKHPLSRAINEKIRSGTTIVDISRWLEDKAAEGVGYEITRQALARHAKDHVNVQLKRGRRPPSENFLQAVVDTAHDALEDGSLRVTARDAISAQAELNRQTDRSADRDLMAKIALALTGQIPITARVLDPEDEAIAAEFTPLLTSGN